MAYYTQTHASTATIADRAAALLDQFRLARKRRALYRETVNELSALSNRELADLGIARSMIRRLAIEAAGELR